MITKDAVIKILKDMDLTDRLIVCYDGFVGRGINGLENKEITLTNNFPSIVKDISCSDGSGKRTELLNYWIEDDYIKAKYSYYTKSKYNSSSDFRKISTYFMIIPYDRISSMEIITLTKNE